MPRALLALLFCLSATTAFANPTVCAEDPSPPAAKTDRSVVTATPATPATPGNPTGHTPVVVASNGGATTSAAASANANAVHASRTRVISPRWQSFLPGMIR